MSLTTQDISTISQIVKDTVEASENRLASAAMKDFTRIDGRLDQMDGRLDQMDERFDRMDKRLDGIDDRLDGIDRRLDGIDGRLDNLDGRLVEVEGQLGHMKVQLIELESGQNDIKWQLAGAVTRDEFQSSLQRIDRLERKVLD